MWLSKLTICFIGKMVLFTYLNQIRNFILFWPLKYRLQPKWYFFSLSFFSKKFSFTARLSVLLISLCMFGQGNFHMDINETNFSENEIILTLWQSEVQADPKRPKTGISPWLSCNFVKVFNGASPAIQFSVAHTHRHTPLSS